MIHRLFVSVLDLCIRLSRSDTVRYALDILAILVVVPKVQLVLADTIEVLDETRSPVSTVGQYKSLSWSNSRCTRSLWIFLSCRWMNTFVLSAAGMSVILGVAEGEVFVNDAEIQKSALQVSSWL